jgi:hypothetical protein
MTLTPVARSFPVSSTVQIKCKAGKGMFPYEAGVLIQGTDRFYESMMDLELVHLEGGEEIGDDDQPATIEATVINVNCTSLLVELPRQVVAGGRRVWIPMSEVASDGHFVEAGNR